MENFAISDSQISASSKYSDDYLASFGRLNYLDRWAWSALTNDDNQWLQVDLRSQNILVTGIATEGNQPYPFNPHEYVTSYTLQYGNDEENFYFYREQGETTDKVK